MVIPDILHHGVCNDCVLPIVLLDGVIVGHDDCPSPIVYDDMDKDDYCDGGGDA